MMRLGMALATALMLVTSLAGGTVHAKMVIQTFGRQPWSMKSGSQLTRRWREPDSNCRSRSCEKLSRKPIRRPGTGEEAREG
jgi:hypothetical protein